MQQIFGGIAAVIPVSLLVVCHFIALIVYGTQALPHVFKFFLNLLACNFFPPW